MKSLIKAFVMFLFVFTLVGCKSFESNTYKTLGTVEVAVDVGFEVWKSYVKSGQATAVQQETVRTSFEKYQASRRVLLGVIIAYKKNPGAELKAEWLKAVESVTENSAEIISLVQTFTKKPI